MQNVVGANGTFYISSFELPSSLYFDVSVPVEQSEV
jgi:hypothetical protein